MRLIICFNAFYLIQSRDDLSTSRHHSRKSQSVIQADIPTTVSHSDANMSDMVRSNLQSQGLSIHYKGQPRIFRFFGTSRQEKLGVLVVVCLLYFLSVFAGLASIYQSSRFAPRVKYFTISRQHCLQSETNDLSQWIDNFNEKPSSRLVVSGFQPVDFNDPGIFWRGAKYRTAFHFGLDLIPFISHGSVTNEDQLAVEEFLSDPSPCEIVKIRKQLQWDAFDGLADRIREHLSETRGFNGIVDVSLQCDDDVTVFQNQQWSNFVHCTTTKVLCVLSLFGVFLYWPYFWSRKTTEICSKFKVTIDTDTYFAMISDNIHDNGFREAL